MAISAKMCTPLRTESTQVCLIYIYIVSVRSCLSCLAFSKKKKKNNAVFGYCLSHCVRFFYFLFFISCLLSATHVLSETLRLSCLLLSFLDFCSQTQSPSHLHFLPNPNPTKQSLMFPPQSHNVILPPNHFSLLFCSQSHNFSSKP